MHFAPPAHPGMLFLLIIPGALALWLLIGSGAAVEAPIAQDTLRSQPFATFLLKAGLILPPAILACFIVLLSEPSSERKVTTRTPSKATNIEILLNASRSMLARSEIGYHCRYCASKVAIEGFVKQRTGNTMGISIFGSRHLNLVPLTSDLNCVTYAISRTFPDYIAFAIAHEKNFEEGITRSVEKLAERATSFSGQILILVTDGESPQLAAYEEELLKLLIQNNVTLYVAMIADGNTSPVLARLAEGTRGGRLFECRDAMGFFEVMRRIDRMNTIDYELGNPIPVPDREIWIAILASLAILYALSLASSFRSTPW